MRYRIVFYGVQKYLENFDFNKVLFKQWMRVVWNIAQNTDITDAIVMIGVLQLVDELGAHANSIYSFLGNKNNILTSKAAKIAIEEERRKAEFIINKTEVKWEKDFIEAEKNSFLKGAIDFLIDDNISEKTFLNRVSMADKIFDENGFSKKYRENGHILLRGLISNYSSYNDFFTKEYKRHRKFFTDKIESENYLKKMLTTGSDSSDKVFISTIKRYLDVKDEKQLLSLLDSETKRTSQIANNDRKNGCSDEIFLKNLKYAHESLYSIKVVQDWMQKKDAIRFDIYNNNTIFVAKPRAWYDWICFDEFRREIVQYLVTKGFEPDSRLDKTFICVGYTGCYKEINEKEYCVWLNANGDVNLKIDGEEKTKLKLNYRTSESKGESIPDFCEKMCKKFGI